MLWAKLLVPVLLVAAGGTAAVAAANTSTSSSVGTAAVWIDNPPSDRSYAPGTVAVDAHGVADTEITALVLSVDGKDVATDDDLEVDADLVYATFDWDAAVGTHELVVAQVGGAGRRSDPRVVTIAEGAPEAPKRTESTTTTRPGATTSTSSTSTSSTTTPGETTTTGPAETTTTQVGLGTTAPAPITIPPTSPPPTTAPAAPPSIRRAVLAPSDSAPNLYIRPGCPFYTVDVIVSASNTTSITAVVDGTSFGTLSLASSDGFTYRGTFRSGTGRDSDAGSRGVTVTARGPGGSAQASAGTIQIRVNCPKD